MSYICYHTVIAPCGNCLATYFATLEVVTAAENTLIRTKELQEALDRLKSLREKA